MSKKFTVFIVFFCLIFISCGGVNITINESVDKTILQLHKSENKNKVFYSVKTDGHCSVLDIHAYWKMDDEDGHTETLLWIEEGLYGIENFNTKDTITTFSFSCFPQKTVKVIIEETEPDEKGEIYCNFLGVGIIEGKTSVTKLIEIQNEGTDVKKAEIKGVDYVDRTIALSERLPTQCQ